MSARTGPHRIIWIVSAGLVILCAAVGLIRPTVYTRVISSDIEPGVFSQDAVALLAAVVLLFLAVIYKGTNLRQRISAHGILGLFFYAYGIYTIEQVYTWLYPAYLAIFSLSAYGLVYGITAMHRDRLEGSELPSGFRIAGAAFGIIIALMFNVIWFMQLIPLIQTANRIEYTYSVYVIDLCFVMPAFVISSLLALRNRTLGLTTLPSLFVVGIGILSPLVFAELIKPARYGMAVDRSALMLFSILTILFIIFFVLFLTSLRARRKSIVTTSA